MVNRSHMEIKRDLYLNKLIGKINNSMIKVITGIRRCGKSYLLNKLFYGYLIQNGIDKEHIISVSLDSLQNLDLHNPYKLDQYIREKIIDDKKYFIFLDEIQEVDKFVYLLNGLNQIKNVDIYVTGSNSKFLSKDIITEFRGRGDKIQVNPLSFKEFYDSLNKDFDEALQEYLIYGGMPMILNVVDDNAKNEYLSDLYTEIYIKDIKERYKIRNDAEMSELLNIISSSIGSLSNPTKLVKTFKSVKNVDISKNTISSYLEIFEESFLIRSATRYDIKGKKYIDSPKKYYFMDLGLRNARLNFRQIEENHLMGNLIYNELKNRGFSVDVGVVPINEKNENGNYTKKQTEVDFVVNKGSNRIYIQSAYRLPDLDKLNQEIKPLINIPDSFKKVIIVRDNIKLRRDENGIITMSLKEFLLNENVFEN